EIASFMSQQSFYLNHDLHEANRSLISTLLRKMPSTNQIVKDHSHFMKKWLSPNKELTSSGRTQCITGWTALSNGGGANLKGIFEESS
ncbi:hypothetical protein, partial [Bremerella alba]|uniref:hypothetical protein n=1 Tax=Bremerella alba TaxID=980252 RepID=UPI001A954DAC